MFFLYDLTRRPLRPTSRPFESIVAVIHLYAYDEALNQEQAHLIDWVWLLCVGAVLSLGDGSDC